jgi:rhamnogalacturonyl hydrolase YesR
MDKTILIESACRDLLTYGVWDGRTKVKRFLKKYILRREIPAQDCIFWTTGMLAQGLWTCREAQTAVKIDDALSAYFIRWRKKGMPVCYLDDLLAGETMLAVYEELSQSESAPGHAGIPRSHVAAPDNDQAVCAGFTKEQCEAAVHRLAAFAMEYPTNENGSFPYRADQKNGYVFADGIGLACPFLYRYGRVFDRQDCKELAVRQIVNFLAYGMDTASGLPYHGYDVSDGCKYGIIGWGRAVGWLLRGMTACLQDDYGAERLQNPFTDLMDAALSFQRRDGFFSWQLQAVEGPADTSATGMICRALQQGIRLGILTQEKYGQAFADGKSAIERSVKDGRVYQCSGECLDFAQYPQKYGAYPWSLGPALEVL